MSVLVVISLIESVLKDLPNTDSSDTLINAWDRHWKGTDICTTSYAESIPLDDKQPILMNILVDSHNKSIR